MNEDLRRRIAWVVTGSLLVVAWLFSAFPQWEWLNKNSGAVTTLAAVGSFVATATIAVLTIGTWKLYALEHSREEMKFQRFLLKLGFIVQYLEALPGRLSDAAERDPLFTGWSIAQVGLIRDKLQELSDGLTELRSDVPAGVPVASLVAIDAAIIGTEVGRLLGEPLSQHGSTKSSVEEQLPEFAKVLAGLGVTARRAVDMIPEKLRRVGPGGETYEQLLDDAINTLGLPDD
jgi:hypothetical protein